MRALVTGASGFIGRALCAELLARRHEVSALVRRPGSEPAGTRPVAGDLTDGPSISAALSAARPDCVFHLAAEIASQRDTRKLATVNVEGTSRLLDVCLKLAGPDGQGAPRFVLASTVVTGDPRGTLLTEDTALPVETPYGRSKQEAERLLRESGLPGIVIRPSHVYGPGGWYARELVSRLRQPGRLAVVGRGANLWDVVHVDDVAGALVLAGEQAPPGSTYHVADDAPITLYDFVALTARELGVGPPRRVPVVLARLIAGGNAVDAAVRSARSSNARIKRELGWTLRYPTAAEGVPAAVAHIPPG